MGLSFFLLTLLPRVWRKGLLLNFYANRLKYWKSGLLLCLWHRAKIICSNVDMWKKEFKSLRSVFSANSYPNWFFDKVLRKFEQVADHPSTQQEEAKDFSLSIGIPYFDRP